MLSNSIILQNEYLQAEIIPDFGGFLNSLKCGELELIDGYVSAQDLQENHLKQYKSARLSPFPNRLKDGKYEFEGKEYNLPINFPAQNHAMHGFLAGKPYEIVEQSAEKVRMVFEYDGSDSGFPFPFRTALAYELFENEIYCRTWVENSGTQAFPIGEGWHPYFKLGGKVDDWILKLPKCEALIVDGRMLPTGNTQVFDLFAEVRAIAKTHFDTCFYVGANHESFRTTLVNKSIRLQVWQENEADSYNYLQLYTPENRQTLAIEPMTCAPDAFNNKLGIKILQPNEVWELAWGIDVSVDSDDS